jgi:hypothetical protein
MTPETQATMRRTLRRICCTRWPACNRLKDKRRSDGFCSRCAYREDRED